ncbi:MAG: hypothetical protein ACJ75B_18110 [Flavisolibacter sp.]
MPPTSNSQVQTRLLFQTLQSMYAFKHEIACSEFYVERDVISFVGLFTQDQIDLAVIKYNAVASRLKA